MNAWLAQHAAAFRTAARRLMAAPINTLLSLLAIGVALALPAGGQMLLANALHVARDISPTPQISLFLDAGADRRAAQDTQARLKDFPGVASFRFIPREDALARMREREGLADVIDALPRNPFPDAFVVQPRDDRPEAMERLADDLRGLPKVADVHLDSDWARRLSALLKVGRTSVLMLAVILGTGLVAITFNIIRLQVTTRRAEIEVSRLLGATDAFIRRPFHYYGVLLGLLGGFAAWAIVSAAAWWLAAPIGELATVYGLDVTLRPLPWPDTLILLATAAGLGALGASLSLRQHLGDA